MGFQFEGKKLNEIQDYLEQQMQTVKKIADIPLSKEDYEYLGNKIQTLFVYSNDSKMIIEYKPCVVVYWVFTMIYAENDLARVTHMFESLPQYLQRTYMDLCLDVFGEHGFMKYRKKTDDITQEVRSLLAIQAGLSENQTEIWDDIA